MKSGFKTGSAYAAFLFLLIIPVMATAQDIDDSENAPAPNTEIHVTNADLAAIIKIFSKKTKRNYILDDSVKGKVTINLPGKVSDKDSTRILDAILALKGFTAVPIGTNLWKVIPIKDARRSTVPTIFDEQSTEAEDTAAVVTRVLRLKYVSAEDMQKLISQLISSEGLVNAYSRTNSLLLVDSADNIKRLAEIIKAVDIPSSDRDMTIIPVKHADAAEVAATLNEILGEDKQQKTRDQSPIERRIDLIRSRIRESSKDERGSTGSHGISISVASAPPKITSDQRTNSVIVVADETSTARIKALIAKLDSPVDLSGNRFYVYRCQHASAEELADVLAGLTGSGGSSRSSLNLSNQSTGLSRVNQSARSQRGLSSQRTQSRLASQRRTPGRSRSESGVRTIGGTATANFGDEFSVTADPSTNSLIIAANKSDYEKVLELLKQLDIKRRQVLVEALILEVGITKNESMGTEFVTSTGGRDGGAIAIQRFNNLGQLLSDPTQLANFSVAAASSGTLTLPGNITIPTQTVLVNAAMSNQNVNVLSAPNILATDNEQAEIVVGQNVPFLASTSTSSTNLNNTFNQIDRQDVGITLRLTPQISSGDFVTLNLFTEVSSIILATANSDLGPTTTLRTSETTVITKDSQMVVIGGLMADEVNTSDRGIPFFKDIPFFGSLFSARGEDRRRTNLLIFITPHIIKDQFDHRDITLTERDTMEGAIAENNVYPDREEILRHFNLDRVAEASSYSGKTPGTITPPAPISKPLTGKSTARSASTDTIELKAAPKLPGLSKNLSQVDNQASDASSYIIFKALNAGKIGDLSRFPFTVSESEALVGVVLPEDKSNAVHRFFSIGQSYRYTVNELSLQLQMIGDFNSAQDALTVYPNLPASWHTLSPYEVINLGKGPWTKISGQGG